MLSLTLSAATLLLSTLTSALPVKPLETRQTDCISGVRIVGVRGSNNPLNANYGPIEMAEVVAGVIPGSVTHDLQYPATDNDASNYEWSESSGVNLLTSHIIEHSTQCPDSRYILIGYSQGAQVVGDTLIGYSGTTGQGLPEQYRQNIIGAVQFGDPAFQPGYSFDTGSSTTPGTGARDNAQQYQEYGYNMWSYCDAGDAYCASGGYSAQAIAIHESYFSDASSSFLLTAQSWMENLANTVTV